MSVGWMTVVTHCLLTVISIYIFLTILGEPAGEKSLVILIQAVKTVQMIQAVVYGMSQTHMCIGDNFVFTLLLYQANIFQF